MLLATPAAAQKLGDFGRVAPGFLNDSILEPAERGWRILDGQPVSNFNQTDAEREMHGRVWRFITASHAERWAVPYEVQIKFASLGGSQRLSAEDLFYRWLSREPFASSRVRYNAVADHVGADLLTLPATFASICAVLEIDRQRQIAVAAVEGLERGMIKQQRLRQAENELFIGRFVSALGFRYASYGYALDRLLVETPHAEAVEVDARLGDLAVWVDRAEAHDFCGAGWGLGDGRDAALPGRVLLDAPSEGEYRK